MNCCSLIRVWSVLSPSKLLKHNRAGRYFSSAEAKCLAPLGFNYTVLKWIRINETLCNTLGQKLHIPLSYFFFIISTDLSCMRCRLFYTSLLCFSLLSLQNVFFVLGHVSKPLGQNAKLDFSLFFIEVDLVFLVRIVLFFSNLVLFIL